jgi:hypothetical protein
VLTDDWTNFTLPKICVKRKDAEWAVKGALRRDYIDESAFRRVARRPDDRKVVRKACKVFQFEIVFGKELW